MNNPVNDDEHATLNELAEAVLVGIPRDYLNDPMFLRHLLRWTWESLPDDMTLVGWEIDDEELDVLTSLVGGIFVEDERRGFASAVEEDDEGADESGVSESDEEDEEGDDGWEDDPEDEDEDELEEDDDAGEDD